MTETTAAPIAKRVRLAPSGDELDYFRMTGGDLKAEAEGGDTAAAAELQRRATNRKLKAEAKRIASAAA